MNKNTFVRLENPISMRKDILKTAIDSTKLLKHYEDNKRLKARTEELVLGFKTNLQEINLLFNNLTSKLPKVAEEKPKEIKPEVPKVEKKETKEKQKKEEKPKEIIQKIKLEHKSRLDMELEEIEQKLKNLEV